MANDLMQVSYESAFGNVQLDGDTVKQYLVKGNGAVSDQEVMLFLKLCEAQKLNPFVTGEVYLIKFGAQPAQTVVGYDTYKRRADENPNHLCFESGIVVCRGQSGEIVQKAGACLYPTETLIGGWCRVHKLRNGQEVTTYKEVTFKEYDKGNAIWKEKPCTMIEKVAISQCLREAYPKDYEGMYTAEELGKDAYSKVIDVSDTTQEDLEPEDPVISQAERKHLFALAYNAFGKEKGAEVVKALIAEEGFESTANMKKSEYDLVLKKLVEEIENSVPEDDQQE